MITEPYTLQKLSLNFIKMNYTNNRLNHKNKTRGIRYINANFLEETYDFNLKIATMFYPYL
jgi:hypothetical protein